VIGDLRRVLVPFLVTRAGYLTTGLLAAHLLASGLTLQKGNLVHHTPGSPALEIWARWDAEWFLMVADRGYGADDAFVGRLVPYQRGDDSRFFPLYPMLIRTVSAAGLSTLAAGVLVSNLALLVALVALRGLVARDHGETVADRTVWILLAFPTSFFLSAVYAESLLLACLVVAVRLAREDRPVPAGLAAALCVLAKPIGLLAIVPVAMEIGAPGGGRARAGGEPPHPQPRAWRVRLPRVALALLPALVALGGWMAFCHALYGQAAPFVARQERWRGSTSGPWRAFVRYFERPEVHGMHHSTLDFACAALFVLMIPWIWRRLRRSEAAWATLAILLPLGSTLWSFTRFAASIYPAFVLAALWSSGSERRFASIVAAMLPLGGFLMALYAAWWWAG
jgi:mannosyltransferase PIG-V